MSEIFDGTVEIQDPRRGTTILLDGRWGSLMLGRESSDMLIPGGGSIVIKDAVGQDVFKFSSAHGDLFIGSDGNPGGVVIRDGQDHEVFQFNGRNANLLIGGANKDGDIIIFDRNGSTRIRLNGNTGDIELSGADCAEDFEICAGCYAEPGSVMIIESENMLRLCDSAYDRRVAGVISGAGGVLPGITLGKHRGRAPRSPLALNGKAFCKVDANFGSIKAGDLLTTSPTAGHAMKATNPIQSFGTVLGKALQPLQEGASLIAVLISLQ
jgi:hypothetical protein